MLLELQHRLVKPQPAAVVIFGKLIGGELLYRFLFDVLPAPVNAAVQEHLHHHGHVVGVAEQSGVPRNAAKHRCPLVVHIADKLLMSENLIVLGGDDLIQREKPSRLKTQPRQSHRFIKIRVHILVKRPVRDLFDHIFEQIKPEITVSIFLFTQLRTDDLVVNPVFEILTDVHILRHANGKLFRDDRTIHSRVPVVFKQRALVIRYPRFQTGLVGQHILEIQAFFVCPFQIQQIIRQTAVDVHFAFVRQFHQRRGGCQYLRQ